MYIGFVLPNDIFGVRNPTKFPIPGLKEREFVEGCTGSTTVGTIGVLKEFEETSLSRTSSLSSIGSIGIGEGIEGLYC